jgi:hypothetical protein
VEKPDKMVLSREELNQLQRKLVTMSIARLRLRPHGRATKSFSSY